MTKSNLFPKSIIEVLPEMGITNLPDFLSDSKNMIPLIIANITVIEDDELMCPDDKAAFIIQLKELHDFLRLLYLGALRG